MPEHRTITLSDRKHGLPFSKGLLAQSFMATGLPPSRAYVIATRIQDELRERDELSITVARLRQLSCDYLERMAGGDYARRYMRLYELSKLDKPLVVMIGGTTGVGKSTIATEVAHRLGITRIVSTDSIREVMRGIFTRDLMPAIHESAFKAWRGLRIPVPHGANPVIVGFREQTAVVTTGVEALIERSVLEGDSLVIEGVHLVPGYIEASKFEGARVVQLVITVDDEDAHRSHFYIREVQTDGMRPFERYRANFGNIRTLGHYIVDLAREHGIPVIASHQLDLTVADVLEHIVNEAIAPDE
ncbi:MAG: 2-phosphoglycerate kinase [Actinomycetota bacterium]|nr:2-phosphoglycerate kinase [Actinomycetota bacterium]